MAIIAGRRITARQVVTNEYVEGHWRPSSYTVATLPTASESSGEVIYVSDGDDGSPCLAYCDGTNWLRIEIGTAVSAGSASGSP